MAWNKNHTHDRLIIFIYSFVNTTQGQTKIFNNIPERE